MGSAGGNTPREESRLPLRAQIQQGNADSAIPFYYTASFIASQLNPVA
jgi:hypothetical protein